MLPSLPLVTGKRIVFSIQGNSLRLVLVSRGKVLDWAHIPFNPAFLRNGFIANPQGMSQVFRNALAGKGIPRAPAIAAFPGFQGICRLINLPRAKDVDPREVVPREARRLMAFSESAQYLFWDQVAVRETERSFLVLAAPKSPLQALIETVKLAGLPLRKVELAPLALLRATSQSHTIVANVETDSIDIVIAVDSVPAVVRSMWLGDEPLDTDSAPQRLAEELVRTISFYNDTYPEARVSPPLP
ncbi:MAG: hypothetical protein HYX99_02755, partial [Chloroflexi bacterium]|nr:hypothetical protein [Chloroflexota bacterium]